VTHSRAVSIAQQRTEAGVPTVVRRRKESPGCPGGWRTERLGRGVERVWRYGRDNRDERPNICKLTEDDVVDIRGLYKAGAATQQELADCYNVSLTAINQAIHGRTWRDVA
jgi:hypothetical protein